MVNIKKEELIDKAKQLNIYMENLLVKNGGRELLEIYAKIVDLTEDIIIYFEGEINGIRSSFL